MMSRLSDMFKCLKQMMSRLNERLNDMFKCLKQMMSCLHNTVQMPKTDDVTFK